MNFKSLVHGITQSLNWHKERRHTFASMVIGLIDQKNVQHHAFSKSLNTEATVKSKLERIRRFFKGQAIDYEAFSLQLVMTIFKKIPKMDLILDRTNWKFGKQDVNYLVLACKVGSVTFPLFWSLLDHQGCSDFEQRKILLEKFKNTFGFNCIKSFTADREFIGRDWFSYLCQNNVPFLSALRTTNWCNGDVVRGP
jgi:hypothetical protein